MEDFYPQPRNILDDVDNISTDTLSGNLQARNVINEERLESLRLVRSRSNSSSFSGTGYLFLAIVFCMMCCSSILITPNNVAKFATDASGFS